MEENRLNFFSRVATKSCFNCLSRDGKYCKEYNKILTLKDVDGTVLKFDPESCELHHDRRGYLD